MELSDCREKQINAADGGGFRDFRPQIFYGNIIFLPDLLQLVHEIVAKEIVPGNIEGNGNPDGGRTAALKAADMFKNMQIRTMDQAVFFQDRDKVYRILEPKFRMPPPHQSFRTDYPSGGMIVLRLIVNKNLPFNDCLFEEANDFLICHRPHNKPPKYTSNTKPVN